MVSLDLRSSAAEVMGVVTWTLRAADGVDDVQKLWRPHAADFVFEAFSTQCDAFRFADARAGLGLQVYASDKSQSGAKTYIAATYRGFWREYKRMCPSHRHMAEIIREGAPCRLYFDFEFKIESGCNVAQAWAMGDSHVPFPTFSLPEQSFLERSGRRWAVNAGAGSGSMLSYRRERASATMLSTPRMCCRLKSYSCKY